MPKTMVDYRQVIRKEIPKLSQEQAKAVRDFIFYLKDKKIDPDQLYFWTPRWQEKEREADEALKKGEFKVFNSVEEYQKEIEGRIQARSKKRHSLNKS